jgi:hypothetical protein
MVYNLAHVITLDGYKYSVVQNTYTRTWVRQFNTNVTAGVVRLTFVDRGPGLQDYKMTLELRSWLSNSLPYTNGVTQTWDVQLANLEASYGKIAKSLQFIDAFGNVPVVPGTSTPSGIYFIDFQQSIASYSTPDRPSVMCVIELENAANVVN